MADVRKVRARGVEIVGQRHAVQIVERALAVDHDPAAGVEQHGHGQRVGERHADRRVRLAGRVRLLDLLDRDQQILATLLDRGRGAVDEPELVLEHGVTRHVARVHDVVEYDEPALSVLTRLREEAEVGIHRIRCRKIPDHAVLVDL